MQNYQRGNNWYMALFGVAATTNPFVPLSRGEIRMYAAMDGGKW